MFELCSSAVEVCTKAFSQGRMWDRQFRDEILRRCVFRCRAADLQLVCCETHLRLECMRAWLESWGQKLRRLDSQTHEYSNMHIVLPVGALPNWYKWLITSPGCVQRLHNLQNYSQLFVFVKYLRLLCFHLSAVLIIRNNVFFYAICPQRRRRLPTEWGIRDKNIE